MSSVEGLCLGIDLGTSSVKISLVDNASSSKASIFSTSEPTHAAVVSDIGVLGSEQNVPKILTAVYNCLMRITDKNKSLVRCIAICGQMHGVVLWNSETKMTMNNDFTTMDTSNLYTWQDQRASKEFLSHLPSPHSHQCLATGFGCVTLFWLRKFAPEMFIKYNCAGSIMDYVATLLCGLDAPAMSVQVATSWGYFNSESQTWNSEVLKQSGFPVHVLPVVVESGTKVGELYTDWLGIQQGTPVLAALGDLQCSFLSSTRHKTDAVLNMGTSCQLAYEIRSLTFVPPVANPASPVSYFPFFDETYLAVAASLNGGNVLASFVKMLQQWLSVFGVTLEEDIIWVKLTELVSLRDSDSTTDSLTMFPAIFGERHNPALMASVTGINDHNMSLDSVFRSICEGLVKNLHAMMPCSVLIESGIARLVISGSVIDRHSCVKEYVQQLYKHVTVVEGSGADSALGSAIVASKFLENT